MPDQYPPPRPEIPESEQRILGRQLIVPVAFDDYDRGYNPSVEDIYEPAVRFTRHGFNRTDRVEYLWRWKRRVRTFVKPIPHGDCEECAKYHAEFPNMPDEILLEDNT